MSSIFTWNASFLTSMPDVDDEHQQLVALINNYSEMAMCSESIAPQNFAQVSNAMLEYARFHFGSEERLMREAGLDERFIERHCIEHRSFLFEAMHLCDIAQPTAVRAHDLFEFLVHWLAYHILGVDQGMARQIRAVQSGEDATRAFEIDRLYLQSNTEPLLSAMGGLFHQISKSNRDLRALNHKLEERVRERTLELEQANKQLKLLSTHDDLTGLPNRRHATVTLQQLWGEWQRYGENLSLLLLDADHFKEVNDRFGHAAGDGLLRNLATLLRDVVRGSDSVFRLGGDEFLVICPHTDLDGAAAVAKKILAARRPFHTAEGEECWDGALSIGVAMARSFMVRPDELLQAADQALYAAKRLGGACLMTTRQNDDG